VPSLASERCAAAMVSSKPSSLYQSLLTSTTSPRGTLAFISRSTRPMICSLA
jgi:hypothetical protein